MFSPCPHSQVGHPCLPGSHQWSPSSSGIPSSFLHLFFLLRGSSSSSQLWLLQPEIPGCSCSWRSWRWSQWWQRRWRPGPGWPASGRGPDTWRPGSSHFPSQSFSIQIWINENENAFQNIAVGRNFTYLASSIIFVLFFTTIFVCFFIKIFVCAFYQNICCAFCQNICLCFS